MRVWTPLETAWPAGALLIGVLASLWISRRHFALPRRERHWLWGLMILSFLVRWVWLPVLARHTPDGHEADYFDRFQGLVEPTRGGTVMYPSMQWLWYGLGRVLPHDSWVPSFIMVLVSCAGIAFIVMAIRTLTKPELGWIAGVLLALHPVHAAWSSSAYNVILPFSLGALGWAAAAKYCDQRRPKEELLWLCLTSLALAVATRLDSVVLAGPPLLWLCLRPPVNVTWKQMVMDRAPHVGAGVVTAGLLWFCIDPLVTPAEIPGAGEHTLSLAINWNFVDVHFPFDGPLALMLLVLCSIMAVRRWPLIGTSMLILWVGNHLLMATFNDYADRHALMGHAALVFLLAAGTVSVVEKRRVGHILGLASLLGIFGHGLWDMRDRFYGSDDRFNALLAEGVWAELPRMTLIEASTQDGESCGWVGEAESLGLSSTLSHFNLIDEMEEREVRGPNGCLRWCADVQDWKWSSRSVRDRALRLMHLYHLDAIGVLGESDGFQCLVIEVQERGVDDPDHIPDWMGPVRFP